MPTLTEIYRENAEYVRCSGFKVEPDERYGTVAIEDKDGNGFFLQGDEGCQYNDEWRKVWSEAGDLALDDAYYGHAKQYIDCLD